MLHIARMRRSIDRAHLEIGRSWNAVLESKELLDRFHLERF
jgi:branched-subunit amino acid aminotransferase/4-amino-4-deoxychorismate lyase